MVWDAFRTTREHRQVTNKVGFFYTVAHAILNFGGAGLRGIMHTISAGKKMDTRHTDNNSTWISCILRRIRPSCTGDDICNAPRNQGSYGIQCIKGVSVLLVADNINGVYCSTITGAAWFRTYMERLMGWIMGC